MALAAAGVALAATATVILSPGAAHAKETMSEPFVYPKNYRITTAVYNEGANRLSVNGWMTLAEPAPSANALQRTAVAIVVAPGNEAEILRKASGPPVEVLREPKVSCQVEQVSINPNDHTVMNNFYCELQGQVPTTT